MFHVRWVNKQKRKEGTDWEKVESMGVKEEAKGEEWEEQGEWGVGEEGGRVGAVALASAAELHCSARMGTETLREKRARKKKLKKI